MSTDQAATAEMYDALGVAAVRGVNVYANKQINPLDWAGLLHNLRAVGCNAIALHIPELWAVGDVGGAATLLHPRSGHYPRDRTIYPDLNQDGTGHYETPPLDTVYAMTQAGQDAGFTMVLKPVPDCHWAFGGRGGWRGFVRVPQGSMGRKFTEDYTEFLRPYARIAQELDADLCLQCEMYMVTKEHGSIFWEVQAQRVRKVLGFTKALTTSVNWGPPGMGSEWRMLEPLARHLDYFGISWYEPILLTGDQTYATYYAGLAAEMQALRKRINRPVAFMEVGWPHTDYADIDPFGNTSPPGEYKPEKALALAQAFRAALDPVLYAYYVWEASGRSFGLRGTHNIMGQPGNPELPTPVAQELLMPRYEVANA